MMKGQSGDPKCKYNGKEAPCFFGASPQASITPELLMSMLKFMDDLNLFDCSVCKPFLLLDGHGSRMQLPFLKYINDSKDERVCCIGVLYATHVWQVADASELNGLFKIELTQAKWEYLRYQTTVHPLLIDIVPLLKQAWQRSFGNQDCASKGIASREWNPLNDCFMPH
jgi:hypothetical protein